MEASKLDKRYNSIDLCKFIMAFFVVAIHTCPLNNSTNKHLLNIYNLLVGLAVPFFFLASGYLLAAKMDYPYGNQNDISRIKRQLVKILRMYVTWSLIYLPLAVYQFIATGTPFIKAFLLYVRGFFFLGEQYNSWPLWYLLSTILSLAVIGFILKKKKSSRALIVLIVVASILNIGISGLANYNGNLPSVIVKLQKLIEYTIASGRLFSGMIYIPAGMLLAHKRMPKLLNWAVFVVCFIANYFIADSIISSYLLMFTAFAFFGIVERIELKNNKWYAQLRSMSTTIYLMHMYVWTFYYKIIYGEKTYGVDSFIVTAIIVTIIAFTYSVIECKRKALRNQSSIIEK